MPAAAAAGAMGAWWFRRAAYARSIEVPPVRGSLRQSALPEIPRGADRRTLEDLSDIVRQLEDLEHQRNGRSTGTTIHEDRAQAHRAWPAATTRRAVVAYSSAVRRLMQAVRDIARAKTTRGINLGGIESADSRGRSRLIGIVSHAAAPPTLRSAGITAAPRYGAERR